jgi:type I restriction enzyme R subunit
MENLCVKAEAIGRTSNGAFAEYVNVPIENLVKIQNYKNSIPSIFYYNALTIISDGIDARVSSLSAPYSRYLAWKSPEKKENEILPELQIMTQRMFKKDVLLHLIRFNTVYEKEEIKDEKTGVLSIVTIKKIAAYH